MEKVNFNYSLKNIPIPSNNLYLKTLIDKVSSLIRRMRWKAYFFDNPEAYFIPFEYKNSKLCLRRDNRFQIILEFHCYSAVAGDRVLRISLILTVKKSVVARLDYLGYKFAKFGFFLTCLDRKILYLWTNLIETILVLFCSLFMLVLLCFVYKQLFSIIFTC